MHYIVYFAIKSACSMSGEMFGLDADVYSLQI